MALVALEKNGIVRNPGAQIFNGRLGVKRFFCHHAHFFVICITSPKVF